MCQPSLKMQTAKQQFEPQRASWEKIIYSSVFAAGIALNHTQFLHFLGMLSVWDQNKSNTVGSPHPFLQIAFFRNLEPRKQEWCLHRYRCLICPWTQTEEGRQSWTWEHDSWQLRGEQKSCLFSSFPFQKASINTPLVTAPRGTGAENSIQMH